MENRWTFTIPTLLVILCFSQISLQYSIRIDDNFQNERDNVTCEICPVGTFSGSYIESGKLYNCSQVCTPGSCPMGINCTACPAGQHNDNENATICVDCLDGQFSHMGAANCSLCKPGTTSNNEKDGCKPCPAGTCSPVAGSDCDPCLPGQYNNASGLKECWSCQKGSYNPLPKQSRCIPCGIGFYNPERHSPSSVACLTCPAGYYCQFDMTAIPEACPEDSYCPTGSSTPKSCALLFTSAKASDSCQPKAALYLLMLSGVAVLVLIISVVVCIRTNRPKEQKHAEKEPTESDRLIPEPRDGPVYEGL